MSDVLGARYRVEEEIGRGGMGVVVRARDIRLDRMVAIKTLPAHLAADPVIRERFLREARTAASLSHPNIVPIHHADEIGALVFFVMGLVEGRSVAQRVRGAGPYAPADAVRVLVDVATALDYAHGRGVIHRDIKAENILVDDGHGRSMVTDFGIARVAESAPMTATGTVLGTVHYMSPEQVRGESLDGRSDLYALGVLAFYMLSGRFPFEHDAASAVLVAHVMSSAPALRSLAPRVPQPLAEVVDRLLQRELSARYDTAAVTAAALQGALDAFESASPVPATRLSAAAAQHVWERAALLQEMTGQHVPPAQTATANPELDDSLRSGYALNRVREAAAEAGIDAKYMDRALAERQSVAPATGVVRPGPAMNEPVSRFLGSRTRLEYEAVIDGELTTEEMEEVVDELRRAAGEFGSLSAVGRTVTFTSQYSAPSGSYPRKLQVSVTTRGGRTTLRAYEDLRQLSQGIVWGITGGAGGGVGGATFGGIMAATKGAAIAVAPFAFLGVALAAYGSARLILRQVVKKKERELTSAMQTVSARIQEIISARRNVLGGGSRKEEGR